MGHGHVIPNPDGSRARCGGPALCPQCAMELDIMQNEHKANIVKENLNDSDMKSLLSLNLPERLKKLEARYIKSALIEANWNNSKAAKLLGIGRTNLLSRMRKLKLETPLQLVRRKEKEKDGTN